MVAHFTMRTYGVNEEFRFVESIWLHRKSRQSRFFSERPILHHTCATYSELSSYVSTIGEHRAQYDFIERWDVYNNSG